MAPAWTTDNAPVAYNASRTTPSADRPQHQPEKPRRDEYADYYAPYVAAVEGPLFASLERDAEAWRTLLARVPPHREGYRYARGKWSVREVVGHVTDAERMFCMRMMAFARGDRSHFPGFDENVYVAASGADRRTLSELGEELAAVRVCTLLLMRGFEDGVWDRRGVANDCEFTVRSLAWMIAGHSRHHRNVLAKRYLGD